MPLKKPAEEKPRKMDADYLHRAALYYLQRFAASRARLGEVLLRKVARRLNLKTISAAEVRAWLPEIEKLLDRYEESGLLNDAALAGARVANMRAGGKSAQDITRKLQHKGFSGEHVKAALAVHEEEGGPNDAAALEHFIRKKKFGPWRAPEKNTDPKRVQKEIAALLRAGFDYQLVRSAMLFTEQDLEQS